MRLKTIYISRYKNLKEFNLNFDGNSFIDVFVGKNGTGKSNLFEALIEIFRHLYEFNNRRARPIISFEYTIKFEINNASTEIEWKNNILKINGTARKRISDTPLPDNILIYYSGHNENVNYSNSKFQAMIKRFFRGGKNVDFNRFMYFDRAYKKLLITIFLTQPFDENIAKGIKEKLGIQNVEQEFIITLKRPYIVRRTFKIDRADDKTLFWGIEGQAREFLRRLSTCDVPELRLSGYISNVNKPYYKYFISIKKFKKEFQSDSVDKLIELFNEIKIIDIIDDIKFNVTLQNDQQQDINYFSDGQFQSIYLYSLLESFQDRNCLTLMDEPDSFLHPEWQFEFLKQTNMISEPARRKNHVLLTTHSPSTIAALEQERLVNFELRNYAAEAGAANKKDIISSLSAGLMTYSENEIIKCINKILKKTTQPILFTEGVSDEMIFETAWNKLYPLEKRKFEIQNAFSKNFLRNLMKDTDLYQNYRDRIFFSIFDFDEAYNDWNQLGDDIQSDPYKCLTKKYKNYNSYSMLLPVPSNSLIAKQVINSNTGGTYGGKSLLTIELLFYGVQGLENYFIEDITRTDNFIKFISDKQKVNFAQNIVPTVESKYFEIFRPIFEFIKGKCPIG
ncbi:AAA family ATPase [Candidatus Dependentiae bacterium]|nr:AAA family ATPase [Candidatus Dependentiae bacterium]